MSPGGAGVGGDGYRALFEASTDGMMLAAGDGEVRDANPSACRLLGRRREELVGTALGDLCDPSYPVLERAWERLRDHGGFYVSARLKRGDGSTFPAGVTVGRHGDAGLGVVFREAGTREEVGAPRAGQEARAGAAEYRAMVEGAVDAMLVCNLDNTFRYVNPALAGIMGYEPEEMVGMFVPDIVHPDDLARAAEANAEIENTAEPHGPYEVRYRRRDGSWVRLETTLNNLAEDPEVRGVVAVCRDVTERSEAEKKIAESERRFRGLVENAHDFVVLADENNVALYASPSIERVMGYAPEEFVGTVIAGYVHPDDLPISEEDVGGTLPTPGPHTLRTVRYRRKDGSYRHIEAVINNRLEDPALRGVVCNCRDVTERVEAEARLRESEERHRALSENALDFVVVQRADNTLSYVSPSIERLLGWKPEEALGKVGADFIHPEDLEWAWPTFYKMLQTPGLNEGVVIRYRHKDGSWRWFESNCNNQLDNPAVEGLVFNCRDITERVEAEEGLRESEERFRALIENGADLVVVQRADATVSYVSPSVERLLGYSPEEFVAVGVPAIIHPEDLEGAWGALGEVVENPGTIRSRTLRYQHKDGSWRVLETVCNSRINDPSVRGLVFNCRDVTERVEAEERLREAEERYRMLVEQVPAATYVERNDTESSTIYVSPQIEALLGYTPDEWVADPGLWLRSLHPEDHGRVFARHLRCNETGEPFDEEYRAFARDGREVWVRDEARLVHGAGGKAPYWQGVKADITGRKRAELEILRLNTELRGQVSGYTAELKAAIESLKESEAYLKAREERYHATFEQAAVGIAHVSPEGRWIRVNEKLCSILGYDRGDLLRRTFQDITHPDDLRADTEQMGLLLSGETGTYSIEKRYLRADGSVLWAKLTVSLVRDATGAPDYFISIVEDVSRRKGAEALLMALSPREIEVLGGIVRGRTNGEIADDMAYSANTIKTYVKNITEKLGATDRTQAAVYAVEMGLFSSDFRIPEKLKPPAASA